MTWRPLTLANTKETQAELESIIGLNRATFGAGPYLAQGNAGAFPDAPASERQAIIASALDPKGYWPKAAKAAAEERLAAERAIEGTRAQIADREEIVAGAADLPSLIDAIKDRDDARSLAHTADAATEQAQERVGANAAAVERHRATAAAERTAEQERARAVTALTEAAAAAQQIPDAERSLTDLDAKIARIPRLEQEAEDHRAALSQHQIAKEQHNAANAVAASALTASRDAYTKGEKMMRDAQELQATIEHLELSADAARHCTLCEQVLTDEGRAATLANLRTQLRNMDADILTHAPEIIRTEREAQEAREIADAITVPDLPPLFDNAPRLAEAREAATSRGVVSAMLAGYRQTAERLPALEQLVRESEKNLSSARIATSRIAETMDNPAELDRALIEAKAAAVRAHLCLTDTSAVVVRLEERTARIRDAEVELAILRADTSHALDQIETLRLAERAFGRDGVPKLIVENVLTNIETNANIYLREMPVADYPLRIELHTQVEQKTVEHLKETLEVMVADLDGIRPFETYSGGEQARVNIALRLALAVLLADRAGGESRLLAIDELEYLDAEGQAQLVKVIAMVADRFDVILVASHYPAIRDSFDNVIEVSKRDGICRIQETA